MRISLQRQADESELAPELDDTLKLCVHHVGGRGGDFPFPLSESFERDISLVLYDADESCIKQIEQATDILGARTTIYPFLIWRRNEKITFNLCSDPRYCSVYLPNLKYGEYYTRGSYNDIIFSEASEIKSTIQYDAVTLDYLIGKGMVSTPDFLSVDAQGADYDVLSGALTALTEDVSAVVVETMLIEMYEGQRSFGDLLKFMQEQGFEFARFLGGGGYSPYRSSIGLRGPLFQNEWDALFLKKVESVVGADDRARYIKLRKLAFIAVLYGYMQYAAECLRQCRKLSVQIDDSEMPVYWRMLNELQEAIGRMPALMPKATNTYVEAAAAQERRENSGGLRGAVKRQFPDFSEWTWNFMRKLKDEPLRMTQRLTTSPVEAVLKRYGLKAQAKELKNIRVQEYPDCR